MDAEAIRKLLERVQAGRISPDKALEKLRHMPYEDMGFAKVDHHRSLRNTVPEVVYAEGMTPEEVVSIAKAIYKSSKRLLITRATSDIHKKLRIKGAKFHARAGIIAAGGAKKKKGKVLVRGVRNILNNIIIPHEDWTYPTFVTVCCIKMISKVTL